jgi:hypothetical protein
VTNVWEDVFAGGGGGGDVIGPAGATDESIALFDGTTGKIIKEAPARIREPSTSYTSFELDEPNNPGNYVDAVSRGLFIPNGWAGGDYIILGGIGTHTTIRADIDPQIELPSNVHGRIIHEKIQSPWDVEKPGTISQDVDDATKILTLRNGGDNLGELAFRAGDRSPQFRVSGSAGDVYAREDGALSDQYQHKGASSSVDDWYPVRTRDPYGLTIGTPWVSRLAAENITWRDAASCNGVFVAVGSSGTNRTMRSVDRGVTWEPVAAAEANQWFAVACDGNVLIAVSISGTNRTMRSFDEGQTWGAIAAAEANQWVSVAQGEGVFVAVSLDGTNRVMRSTDSGASWSAIAAAAANQWTSVDHDGDSIFAAVSNTGTNRVMRSTSAGLTWASVAAASNDNWTAIKSGEGVWVAVSSDGTIMRSDDGAVTWSNITAPAAYAWRALDFIDGVFVAVSTDGASRSMRSTDLGLNWTLVSEAEANDWRALGVGDESVAAVSIDGTNRVMTSGKKIPPGFEAYKDTLSQTAVTGVALPVTYNKTRHDAHEAFASSKFTAPVPGWYAFSASQTVTTGAAGTIELQIVSSVWGVKHADKKEASGAISLTPNCSARWYLGKDEEVTVQVLQVTGVNATVANTYSVFSGNLSESENE